MLQMRIAIAKSAVQCDESEELFLVFMHVRGISELPEAFQDRGFVAAAIFFVRPAGVEDAEVLESAISPAVARVETVNHQRHSILGEAERRHLDPYFRAAVRQKYSFAASCGYSFAFHSFTMWVAPL